MDLQRFLRNVCVSYSALFQAVGGSGSNSEVRQTSDNKRNQSQMIGGNKSHTDFCPVGVVGIFSLPVFTRKKKRLIEMRPLRGGLNVS